MFLTLDEHKGKKGLFVTAPRGIINKSYFMHLKHHLSEGHDEHHQNPCWAFIIEFYWLTSEASVTTNAI